jgi:hypothetical protein
VAHLPHRPDIVKYITRADIVAQGRNKKYAAGIIFQFKIQPSSGAGCQIGFKLLFI